MTVEVKTTMKFKPWRAPNFAVLDTTGTEGHPIPINDLDADALEALARSWLEDLYAGTEYHNPFVHQGAV
jgi:hypothetical protein